MEMSDHGKYGWHGMDLNPVAKIQSGIVRELLELRGMIG
jgi:hypothetical protein